MATNESLSSRTANLTELKETVRKLLPTDSQFRSIVLSQPDTMLQSEVVPKLETLIQILYAEQSLQARVGRARARCRRGPRRGSASPAF